MVVDKNGKIFLIDFEYAMAVNRFHDIGHFFRRKSGEVERFISQKVYEIFFEEYNTVSKELLPDN